MSNQGTRQHGEHIGVPDVYDEDNHSSFNYSDMCLHIFLYSSGSVLMKIICDGKLYFGWSLGCSTRLFAITSRGCSSKTANFITCSV